MWRGRGRRPSALGSPRPCHRSEGMRLSDRLCPVKTAGRKHKIHCPGALHEGDAIRVFSQTANAWIDGQVVKIVDEDLVRIEYEVGEQWYGKTLHKHSEHLVLPPTVEDLALEGPRPRLHVHNRSPENHDPRGEVEDVPHRPGFNRHGKVLRDRDIWVFPLKSTLGEVLDVVDHGALPEHGAGVQTLKQCANHPEVSARAQAITALGNVACGGDQHALGLATQGLQDPDATVRSKAIADLGRVAREGDQNALELVAQGFMDDEFKVHCAAAQMAHDADQIVLQRAIDLISPASIGSRLARLALETRLALEALETPGHRGHRKHFLELIALQSQLYEHQDSCVRRIAVQALGRVSQQGDEHAIELLLRRLDDGDRSVRRCAVQALGKVAWQGDQHAMQLITMRLADTDEFVRAAAVQALGKVARRGDQHAMHLIAQRQEDVDHRVRNRASDAYRRARDGFMAPRFRVGSKDRSSFWHLWDSSDLDEC